VRPDGYNATGERGEGEEVGEVCRGRVKEGSLTSMGERTRPRGKGRETRFTTTTTISSKVPYDHDPHDLHAISESRFKPEGEREG
jgi:hypothetical protein